MIFSEPFFIKYGTIIEDKISVYRVVGIVSLKTEAVNIIKNALTIYCLYVLVTGGIIFGLYRREVDPYLHSPMDEVWDKEGGQDRVALVEGRYYSGISRINLLENAEKSLDIAYYTVDNGVSADIFFGQILEVADRGVQVRILLDGIFHHFRGLSRDTLYAFIDHPNIKIKYYEPLNPLKPWTWHNRLHDKFIIVDNEIAMIGGRNIGDRYFLGEGDGHGDIVRDRDVILLNTEPREYESSVIKELDDYFALLWGHQYSKSAKRNMWRWQSRRGERRGEYLREYIGGVNKSYPELFNNPFDWQTISVPTNKISLIHNPIQRFNKEPWILNQILRLMDNSEGSIFIQSPYIIPTRNMLDHESLDNILSKEITILTNSLGTSPNYPAMGGYIRHRRKIRDVSSHLYEYQGVGSIHGKSYIIDDRISLVGSFNLDARSAFLSTETMVVIDSYEFAKALNEQVNELVESSLLVDEDYSYAENPLVERKKPSFIKWLLMAISSVLTFFFDYLL